MDKLEQLLYSYARIAIKLETTGEASYKKTLGMFRMRLKEQGVFVKTMKIEGEQVTLDLEVDGAPTTKRLPKPADS